MLQALIWDIQQMPRAIEDPILAYTAAEGEINQIQWGVTQPDWIGQCTPEDRSGGGWGEHSIDLLIIKIGTC